ncbi:MAG: type I methionyl aminopeptidase [Gemmataceae bacterium]|nr:type I methionyl aminopeptidase [Gemmataceae bacterium]
MRGGDRSGTRFGIWDLGFGIWDLRSPEVWKGIFPPKPELKSRREIALMREAGKLVAAAHQLCKRMAVPGTRTGDIDAAVEALFASRGATPLFKGYPGQKVPFPASTCISINEEVVHGIPGSRQLRDGDLLKIDTACKLNGWCADAAVTHMIGNVTPAKRRLVEIGEQVLRVAMVEMARRRWWSEVAREMQKTAEAAGYSVVTQYVGHGIGRIMHEAPQVPNFLCADLKKEDFRLEEGLVLAVEPMVNMGKSDTDTKRDHWTVVTRDRLPSVHVEHTLAITAEGVEILTAAEGEETLVPRPGALVTAGAR